MTGRNSPSQIPSGYGHRVIGTGGAKALRVSNETYGLFVYLQAEVKPY